MFVFLLSGCTFFWEKPAPKMQKQVVKKQNLVKKRTAIKGVITELLYKDERYCYTIISTDMTNAKLPSAQFCSPKFYHDKGDLVYATFFGNDVESMLLIRQKSEQKSVKMGKKPTKTNIAPPKEEKISFD